jgi:choline dehydrogenase-like flavoprotein
MTQEFDFIIVGGGSAGAVIAARLSEDPTCHVALVEAGDRPPEHELMPVACASLQNDPATDWMYTADPGRAGLGLQDRRMPVPRGKMLGGSSGINYMAYVRGHPGDFDAWSESGALGWSFDEVLPYFQKSEGLVPSDEITLDHDAHGKEGPLGVSVRSPVLQASLDFVNAAGAIGIPPGDYNGRYRGGPTGVASLFQTTTRGGKRCSTYRAFLEGKTEERPNLTIITQAQVTRVILDETADELCATGVEFRCRDGSCETISASREVILCAGAIGSPHILMLSGIGSRQEIETAGVTCVLDLPDVGKHLKDHLYCALTFPAPSIGISRADIEDSLEEWNRDGMGLASSSLYDATVFYSTGLGDQHSHDAQIGLFVAIESGDETRSLFRIDPQDFYSDVTQMTSDKSEGISLLANPVLPHSQGEIILVSGDPEVPPEINMNYFADPHDLKVMVAVMRRSLELAERWPGPHRLGLVNIPPKLAAKHDHISGQSPSDALLEDIALHYSLTVYHLSCTCRIGDVVDRALRVNGVSKLSIADASVMPEIVSGNTNAAAIMIGEKAAEMIARRCNVQLSEFVGR